MLNFHYIILGVFLFFNNSICIVAGSVSTTQNGANNVEIHFNPGDTNHPSSYPGEKSRGPNPYSYSTSYNPRESSAPLALDVKIQESKFQYDITRSIYETELRERELEKQQIEQRKITFEQEKQAEEQNLLLAEQRNQQARREREKSQKGIATTQDNFSELMGDPATKYEYESRIKKEVWKNGDLKKFQFMLQKLPENERASFLSLINDGEGLGYAPDPTDMILMRDIGKLAYFAMGISWDGLCFTPDTKVQTTEGIKLISDIHEGNQVVSCNLNESKCEEKTVDHVFKRSVNELIVIVTDAGDLIKATPNHEFYSVDRGSWVAAELLKPWEHLKSVSGGDVSVRIAEKVQNKTIVYNIEVADNHNYYVGKSGVLVKNCTLAKAVAESRITIPAFIEGVKTSATVAGKTTGQYLTYLKNQLSSEAGMARLDLILGEWGEKKVASFVVENGVKFNVEFRGLIQNRPLSELTHNEIYNAFKNTDLIPSNHAIMRLKEIRTKSFGINSLNDFSKIIKNGQLFDAGKKEIGYALNGIEVIIDPITKIIVTIRPAKTRL